MAAKSMEEIAELFKAMRFRKKILGGVSEADVWKQLDMLQKEYRSAFDAQEERYRALLSERNAMIAKLRRQTNDAGGTGGEPHA